MNLFRPIRNLFTVLFWRTPADPVALAHVKFRRGRFVRKVWISPDFERTPAGKTSILLGSIDTREIEEQEGIAPEFCANTLAQCLGIPRADEVGEPADDELVLYWLDLAITEMRPVPWWGGYAEIDIPGPALPWLLLSWFSASAGHGWLQVEGVLRHEGSIKPLLAFVHRARYAAAIHLPWWFSGKSDPKTSMEALCAATALAILKELRDALSVPD